MMAGAGSGRHGRRRLVYRSPVRFVIVGAGAIGGVVGGRLAESGHEVALIARGAHGRRIAGAGLRVVDARGIAVHHLPVAQDPGALGLREGDVVLLAVKSQDTHDALAAIRAVAPTVPVACLQNGVANERLALRLFERVQAVCVVLPAEHLEPGEVAAFSSPTTGLLDVGRYPSGVDDLTDTLAAAFSASGLESRARPDVMRWKYAKLVTNLGNAPQALSGPEAEHGELLELLRSEAEACFAAAGIDCASAEEDRLRRGDRLQIADVAGHARSGGSSWQSLERGAGSIESDYLNGEIVLLGRLHGVATPANAVVRDLAVAAATERRPAGMIAPEEIMAAVRAASAPARRPSTTTG
jgi:2-dehydropantoate 2-reductase